MQEEIFNFHILTFDIKSKLFYNFLINVLNFLQQKSIVKFPQDIRSKSFQEVTFATEGYERKQDKNFIFLNFLI
jgi:hypothetical protein